MSNKISVGPIELEVVSNALLSVSEEMGAVLVRTSQSTNIKERRDCSCAIFDSRGEVIAQAEHVPMHLGSMLGIVLAILKAFPAEDIRPEDMFITNDPFSGGGTHLPDITVAAPVFDGDRLIGFVANIAHHSDVGGRVAGSSSGDCTSIFEEGLRIPVLKVIERGSVKKDVISFILLNCRTPEERLADLEAQFASNRMGILRMRELFKKFGVDFITAACEELLDYAERKIRQAIQSVPDGGYTFEDYLDDDGKGLTKIPVRVRVEVKGDSIQFDFGGTGRQVRGGINLVYTALQATVYYALKAILDPTIPPNGGYYRAIKIIAPEESLVNAQSPAAVAGRTDAAQRVADVIFGALAQAVPDRVVAGCHSAVTVPIFSGVDPRTAKQYVYLESIGGGMGARKDRDGLDGVQVHVTNTSNLPVEAMENEYPLIVERLELIPDSGGTGRYRGGLGIRKDIRIVGHACHFASHGDRQHIPPWGLFGGRPGRCGRMVIRKKDGKEIVLPSGKNSEILLRDGDTFSVETPGGGGWGSAAERPLELRQRDLADQKVTKP
ncbi:MAG: hydantoinase B/oxoprolinase family protein [Thermodesulfobacteriota bacterium]